MRLYAVLCLLYAGICSGGGLVETVTPTSEEAGQVWRYTFERPREGWFAAGFDDSAWKEGPGGFGTKETPYAVVRTVWDGSDIWLRRSFTAGRLPDEGKDLVLRIHHDEDTQVYLNGRRIAELPGWSTHYDTIDLDERVRKLMRAGENVLAVHCRQTSGGQYIDVGIEAVDRWTPSRARRWYTGRDWLCGFNYVPANAISYTEMWMGYSFDAKLIDAELAVAEEAGFNCLRVALPFVVWEHEPAAFKKRLADFLRVCKGRGIAVMVTLFDDCVFGSIRDPVYGRQPEVVEGWYANGWTPSPGHSLVRDRGQWGRLERYVRDVVGTFREDRRVLCWDLYNEPTNGGIGNVSIPLVERVFAWARSEEPSQPLTVAIWNGNGRLNDVVVRYSDIVTFHSYNPAKRLAEQIEKLQRYERPILCTEWLNRGRGSVVETCLPVFAREDAGCMHWGLVNGKTQTNLPWGHRPGDPPPKVWQHDLYHGDLRPYDTEEVRLFRETITEMRDRRKNGGNDG